MIEKQVITDATILKSKRPASPPTAPVELLISELAKVPASKFPDNLAFDAAIEFSGPSWLRVFGGSDKIAASTKVMTLYCFMSHLQVIQIFVGERVLFEYTHNDNGKDEIAVYWSFPFSTDEDIDIRTDNPADPIYLYFSYK